MIISHKHKFIFFSMPKTGSESLRELFAPLQEEHVPAWKERSPFYSHMTPWEANEAFRSQGLNFNDYARVSCMRNPYPRLVSLYRMIHDVDGAWVQRRRLRLGNPSFGSWLESSEPSGSGGGGRRHQRWRRYGTWSCAAWDGGLLTHQLHLERLTSELPELVRSLDLPVDPSALPHVNARPQSNWRDWYDEPLWDLVAHRYRADLGEYPDFDFRFAFVAA